MNDFEFDDDTIEDQDTRNETVVEDFLDQFYADFGRLGIYHRGEGFQERLRKLLRRTYFGGYAEGRRAAIGEVFVDEPTRRWRIAG